MAEKFGIENLKLLLVLPIELGNIADDIGHSSSEGAKKWLKLVGCLEGIVDLIKVNWSSLKDEVNDLSDAEKVELETYIESQLKLKNVKVQDAVGKSLSILFNMESLIMESIALFKSLK